MLKVLSTLTWRSSDTPRLLSTAAGLPATETTAGGCSGTRHSSLRVERLSANLSMALDWDSVFTLGEGISSAAQRIYPHLSVRGST